MNQEPVHTWLFCNITAPRCGLSQINCLFHFLIATIVSMKHWRWRVASVICPIPSEN